MPSADLLGPPADHGQLAGARVDLLSGIVKMLEHRPHPCRFDRRSGCAMRRVPRGLGLHRADRTPEGDSDIRLREIGQIAENDDLTLATRELAQRGDEVARSPNRSSTMPTGPAGTCS